MVGEHATDGLVAGQDNVLAVKVDNSYNPDIPPQSADYTFFGGLYRYVHLISTRQVHVGLTDMGSSGVYLTPTNVNATTFGKLATAGVDLETTIEINGEERRTTVK